ncbi:hypothetical protein [Lysobacter gummosus]
MGRPGGIAAQLVIPAGLSATMPWVRFGSYAAASRRPSSDVGPVFSP